jgi:DNA invertase Pin-like site-specific DNA recombinase
MPSDPEAWKTFDDSFPAAPLEGLQSAVGPLAFYGRCSTEDKQDPETSRQWQLRAARALVEPMGGEIVAEYFDVGWSRVLPWSRRPEALRLLTDLSSPTRTWSGIVVGEAQRCWYGAQFSDVAPVIEDGGVTLFVPDLGGAYDPRNPSHYILMTVNGGMSRGERQRVQDRIKLGMAAQVEVHGRYQGGVPPYGYEAVPVGPHPNPRKASEGFQLKQLAVVPERAAVVQRIFQEFLLGAGQSMIARRLNEDGVPCPSRIHAEKFPHRLMDGWQVSTIHAILTNGRYTGYEFWGKAHKSERLIDPRNPSLGHRTIRSRSKAAVVRSREPVHEAIITVEEFTAVHQELGRRSAAQATARQRGERDRHPTVNDLASLRGFIRCSICKRKLHSHVVKRRGRQYVYLRCRSRGLTPGTLAATNHPDNIAIAEQEIQPVLHAWLSRYFDEEHIDDTIDVLLDASAVTSLADARREKLSSQLRDARVRLSRLIDAIEVGHVDPASLATRIDSLQREIDTLVAAEASQLETPTRPALTREVLRKLIIELGATVRRVFDDADPADLAGLYADLGLTIVYDPAEHAIDVTATPSPPTQASWGYERAPGGTRTPNLLLRTESLFH